MNNKDKIYDAKIYEGPIFILNESLKSHRWFKEKINRLTKSSYYSNNFNINVDHCEPPRNKYCDNTALVIIKMWIEKNKVMARFRFTKGDVGNSLFQLYEKGKPFFIKITNFKSVNPLKFKITYIQTFEELDGISYTKFEDDCRPESHDKYEVSFRTDKDLDYYVKIKNIKNPKVFITPEWEILNNDGKFKELTISVMMHYLKDYVHYLETHTIWHSAEIYKDDYYKLEDDNTRSEIRNKKLKLYSLIDAYDNDNDTKRFYKTTASRNLIITLIRLTTDNTTYRLLGEEFHICHQYVPNIIDKTLDKFFEYLRENNSLIK